MLFQGEGEVTLQRTQDSINPWTKHLHESTVSKKSPPEDESFTRFKKFWEEVNRRKQADREIEDQLEKEREEKNEDVAVEEEKEQEEGEQGEEKKDDTKREIEELTEEEKEVSKRHKKKPQKSKDKTLKPELDEKRESEDNGEITTKVSKKKKNKKCKKNLGNPVQEAVTIDDLFDQVEIGIKNKVKKKLKKLGVNSKEPWTEVKSKKKHKKVTVATAPSEIEEFDFTSTSNQENIDEKKERVKTLQDLESIEGETVGKLQRAVQTLKNSGAPSGTSASHKPKLQVDPNKFLQVRHQKPLTEINLVFRECKDHAIGEAFKNILDK